MFTLKSLIPNFSGAGTGIAYLISTVRIQEEFVDSKRIVASGISSTGAGVGIVIMSSIRGFVSSKYGWRQSLLVELTFVSVCAVTACFIHPRDRQQENINAFREHENNIQYGSLDDPSEPQGDSTINDKYLYKNPLFYFSLAIAFLATNGTLSTSNYLPDHMRNDLNFTADGASVIMMTTGVSSIVARLLCGVIGSYSLLTRFLIFFSVNLISSIMTCVLVFFTLFDEMVIYAISNGTFSGEWDFLCI